MDEQEHEYTLEVIFNFTCGRCANWWSYASLKNKLPFGSKMNCPHCSYQTTLRKKDRYNLKTGEVI